MKVLIAAAGTGGHINPGIAIANKIKKENPDVKIVFVGTTRGLENDLVPRAGYELKTIQAYGITRKITLDNVKKMFKTIFGIFQARKLIEEFNPDIVVGTGGYICGPIFLAAKKKKIPTILHESNAFPGVTVRILEKKVDKILVSFKEAKQRLPKAKNVVVTGNPTKVQKLNLSDVKINELKVKLGFNTVEPLVLIFGGSQGAKAINDSVIDIIRKIKKLNYQVIWAAGPIQYDIIKEKLENLNININNIKGVKVVPYIYNMEEMMNICDIIVSRSGAMTITEISIVGKPSILIPLPNVSDNYTYLNAKVLEDLNAAKIILNKDITGEILDQYINDIIKDANKLKQMGENARKIAIENVEDKIYEEIKTLKNNYINM